MLAALGACATPDVPATVETAGMPNAELALQRSMAQVDADVGRLGTLQGADASAQPQPQGILPAELQKRMTLQWSGPLDGAVQRLGDAVGYQVTVVKPNGSLPLPVAINLHGPAVDLLRTLGDQAGTRASVDVDPLHHQITVTHHV